MRRFASMTVKSSTGCRAKDGDVLMARAFVPEEYKMNTRLVRTKQGLGVVRVNTKSMVSRELEPPKPQVSN